MSYIWKEAELIDLERLVKEGKSKEYLANYFNRSENAIEVKVNRLGLQLMRTNRNWKKSDLDEFKLDWQNGEISKQVLIKKYNRSYISLRKKALQLNLGARPYNDEYLSINDICSEMCVSYDRVSNWIKLGLKYKRNKSGKTKYLFSQDDLLDFLKEHQDIFNASKISEYLFLNEPDWLISKRRRDNSFYNDNLRCEYTASDDKTIILLFKCGKSNAEIAKKLKRTETAIAGRLRILGYSRGNYNAYELDILRDNSDYMTVKELAKMLPIRSEKGIMYKCKQLGLPYHLVKERCKIRE